MVKVFILAFAMSAAIIWLLLVSKLAWRIAVDMPNDRSLHNRPIPRIGGWGLIPAAIAAAYSYTPANLLLVILAISLFFLSYLDDRLGLPFSFRLATHAVVSIIWLKYGPPSQVMELAGILFFAVIVFSMSWWVNLYNFMDGANGLAGGMALIGFMTYAVAAVSHGMLPLAAWSFALAGASAGFLLFNFHPARVFLGDSGSVPLGFFVATLGMWGWAGGAWPTWFPILTFAPFWLDATATLLRRIISRGRFWDAHTEHYYQRLIRSGWSHRRTTLCEYAVMLASAGMATLMLSWSESSQYIGLVIVGGMYLGLAILVDKRWQRFRKRANESQRADIERSAAI